MSDKDLFIARYGSPKMTHHILDTSDEDEVKSEVFKNPTINSSHIDKGLSNTSTYVRAAAAESPKATSDHITKVLNDNDDYSDVREAAMRNPNVTSAHIDQVLNLEDINNLHLKSLALRHRKSTHEQLMRGLSSPKTQIVAASVMQTRNDTVGLRHILDHKSVMEPTAVSYAMNSSVANDGDIIDGLKSHHYGTILSALSNPKTKEHHVIAALDDMRDESLRMVFKKPYITQDTIKAASMSKNPIAVIQSVLHPLATKEIVDNVKANHPNLELRKTIDMFDHRFK